MSPDENTKSTPETPPGQGEQTTHITSIIEREVVKMRRDLNLEDQFHRMFTLLSELDTRVKRLEQALPDESSEETNLREINDYAVQLHYMGQWDQARSLLVDTAKKHGHSFEVWNNLGVVLTALGERERAVRAFQKALELNQISAEVLNNRGVLAMMNAQPETALQLLEEAHRRRPEQVDVLLNLAQAHVALGQHKKALGCWEIVRAMDPHQEEALQNLRQYYRS